jgi:hypothetical protein
LNVHSRRWRHLWRGSALALLFMSGCGAEETGTVSGSAHCRDGLLRGGRITFTSVASARSVSARIQADGSFTATHCPLGLVKITVRTGPRVAAGNSPGRPGMLPLGGAISDPGLCPVATRYSDLQTTDLELMIVAGPQRHDIELRP